MRGGFPVRLDTYSISLLRGYRGGHARFWYRIGTDNPTKTTTNDGDDSVGASVRRDTISSYLLIGVVGRQTLLDDGKSQYPVPILVPNNWPPHGR